MASRVLLTLVLVVACALEAAAFNAATADGATLHNSTSKPKALCTSIVDVKTFCSKNGNAGLIKAKAQVHCLSSTCNTVRGRAHQPSSVHMVLLAPPPLRTCEATNQATPR